MYQILLHHLSWCELRWWQWCDLNLMLLSLMCLLQYHETHRSNYSECLVCLRQVVEWSYLSIQTMIRVFSRLLSESISCSLSMWYLLRLRTTNLRWWARGRVCKDNNLEVVFSRTSKSIMGLDPQLPQTVSVDLLLAWFPRGDPRNAIETASRTVQVGK